MRQKKFSSSHCQGNLSATIQTQDVFLKHLPTIGRLSPFEQPLSDWRQLGLVISSKQKQKQKTNKKSSFKDELEIQRIIFLKIHLP